MDAVLGDAAVGISIALQLGATPEELAHSVARLRLAPPTPAELDGNVPAATVPATPIGAALDFLADIGREQS